MQQIKARRTTKHCTPCVEFLEDRISPAILNTSDYGSRNPGGGPYDWANPYNMNQVYNAANPQGLIYSPAKFPGTYSPKAYLATNAADYEVNLLDASDAQVSQIFQNTLNAWNAALPQADQWNITYDAQDPIAELTWTVNSYNAYGSAFQRWFSPTGQGVPAGTIAPQVTGMIDVRTNLDAPGVNNALTYGWINIVTTNYPASQGLNGAAANNAAPFVDNGYDGVINNQQAGSKYPFYPNCDQRSFYDIPARPVFTSNIYWSGETALVLQEAGTRNITVYHDSFTWGWTTQPRGELPRFMLTSITGEFTPNEIVGSILGQGGQSTNLSARLNTNYTALRPPVTGAITFIDVTTNRLLGTATPVGFLNTYSASLNNLTFDYDAVAGGARQNHQIRAFYSGNQDYAGTSASGILVVRRPNQLPGMNVSSSTNPSTVGNAVTLTATLDAGNSDYSTPTGSVVFFDGTIELGTSNIDENGVASIEVSSFAAATHAITAVYNGELPYISRTESLVQIVNDSNGNHGSQSATTTVVESTANPSALGMLTTFSATIAPVAPGTGTPTGTVKFVDGATDLGVANIDQYGVATLSVSTLGVGVHNVTAIYSGDDDFNSSSTSITQNVGNRQSTVGLTLSAGSSVVGESVTLTATINPESGTGIPTGSVVFYDNGTELGTQTVNENGNAMISVANIPLGYHTIVAVYSGDATFMGNTSEAHDLQITVADEPTISVPELQTVDAGSALVFSSTIGNAISIGNDNTAATTAFLEISANNGTITLASTNGLTFDSGTGIGDQMMGFSGSISNINAALDGMSFTPDANFIGNATLQIFNFGANADNPSPANGAVNIGVGGSISGRVWHDSNHDGIQDTGESSKTGITVNLYDGSMNLVATKTTDANGRYSFTGLGAGNFIVEVVAPAYWYHSVKDQGSDDEDSDVDVTTGLSGTLTLSLNQNLTHIDAGLFWDINSSSDANNDPNVG